MGPWAHKKGMLRGEINLHQFFETKSLGLEQTLLAVQSYNIALMAL